MKSLMPWFCLVATTGAQVAFAGDGFLDDYRKGNYIQAATELASEKDPIVDYYLARMNLYGYGKLKNNTLAMRHFKQAAEKGLLSAQQIMGSYSLLRENNPEQALYWYKKAADANDVKAQMYCAAAYTFGFGTKKNTDTARRYFIAAARNNDPLAQYTLAEHFLNSKQLANKKLGLIWLNKAIAQSSPQALTKLGQLYAKGDGAIPKDIAKAQEMLNLAIAKGYTPALYQMGELALQENNTTAAIDWFTKAAKKQYNPASVALAKVLLQTNTPTYDPKNAYLWLLRAAQNGSSDAQLELANLYLQGQVVARDENLAKEWQDKAAETLKQHESLQQIQKDAVAWLSAGKTQSFADSDYQLKGIFSAWENPSTLKENNYNQPPQMVPVSRTEIYRPKFVMAEPNSIEISELYDALTGTGHANDTKNPELPQYGIAYRPTSNKEPLQILLTTPLVPNSPAIVVIYPSVDSLENVDYFDELRTVMTEPLPPHTELQRLHNQAVLGVPSAQFTLAQLYQSGIGVEKNVDQAIYLYRLAADQKDLKAEYNLGLLYLEGKDVPANYENAIGWLTRAAFKGNADAQFALGLINEKGYRDANGVEVIKPDQEQATVMYYLAAGNYYGPAQYRLAELLVREKQADVSVQAKLKRNQLIKRLYRGAVVENVAAAELPLAFFNAMEKDKDKQTKAFEVAKKEASKGNGQAALLLGLMYDRGIAVPPNPVEALYWYQQASANPVSSFILGTYFSEGKNINKDASKGRALLQKSADSGFSYANLNLAVIKYQNKELFLPELDTALALGNSKAGLLLADYYLSLGNETQKMQQARQIYQHFAEKGDKEGQLKLAYMFEQGLGGGVDLTSAQQWYTLAAEQGQPVAQYLLGRLYQLGTTDKQPDYLQAKQWYEKAQNKYTPAAVALGFIYDTVEDNYKQAQGEYQLAANKHNPISKFNLGLIYEKGKGQPVDTAKAKDNYLQAAENGHTQAMVQLAGLYFNGVAGPRNEQQALYWYKKAAELGDRDALYQLGLLSETGVAIKLDFPDAINYYQKAAEKGNAKAMLALARMYQYGIGVEKNSQQAVTLYKDLSALSNPYAQYQLATFYFEGTAGERLPAEGKKLLQQAQENGSIQARTALQRLDAESQERVSFIEPIALGLPPVIASQTPELMYLDALNEWNRGNEELSRLILNKITTQFPNYTPARRAYEQLHLSIKQKVLG
jgi:enhanced entry protein EnhC